MKRFLPKRCFWRISRTMALQAILDNKFHATLAKSREYGPAGIIRKGNVIG